MRTSRERIIDTSVRIAELRKEISRLSELQDEVARLEASLDADILPDADEIPGYDEKTISDFVGGLSNSDGELNNLTAPSEPTHEDGQTGSKLPHWLSEAFKILSPREEKILRMRSGLQPQGNGSVHTFSEIAHHFAVDPGRVEQIYSKGRRKLRRHIRESLETLDLIPFTTGFEAERMILNAQLRSAGSDSKAQEFSGGEPKASE